MSSRVNIETNAELVASKLLGFSIYRLHDNLKKPIYNFQRQHPQILELLDTRKGDPILHENSEFMFYDSRTPEDQLTFVIGKLRSDPALLKVAVSYCKFVEKHFDYYKVNFINF